MSLFDQLLAAAPPAAATGSASTWIGGLLCLVLWVAYGWIMRSSSEKLRRKMASMPRSRKVFLGSGGLLLGLILLMGGMILLASFGGADVGGIKLWAWPVILLLGLAFVHTQVIGAAALMTLAASARTDGEREGQGRRSEVQPEETTAASPASEPSEPRS